MPFEPRAGGIFVLRRRLRLEHIDLARFLTRVIRKGSGWKSGTQKTDRNYQLKIGFEFHVVSRVEAMANHNHFGAGEAGRACRSAHAGPDWQRTARAERPR